MDKTTVRCRETAIDLRTGIIVKVEVLSRHEVGPSRSKTTGHGNGLDLLKCASTHHPIAHESGEYEIEIFHHLSFFTTWYQKSKRCILGLSNSLLLLVPFEMAPSSNTSPAATSIFSNEGPAIIGGTRDDSSEQSFSNKRISLRLDDTNFLLWKQQVVLMMLPIM
ncbi:hypothetical protein V6N11_068105 [Hibiscus sabdariffa]|uniref:Uncharacterized protein n=1 Tax=Hibiscus sabdariffa TaxID=183260 RepID=A0ABR2STN6_9ROSI